MAFGSTVLFPSLSHRIGKADGVKRQAAESLLSTDHSKLAGGENEAYASR